MSSFNDGDAEDPEESALEAPFGTAEAAPSPQNTRPPTPKNCRNSIRRRTANAMPDIVKTFVQKAKEGSVPHFTSLVRVGGFDQRAKPAEAPKRKRTSLARQLLEEVERYEAQQAEELAAASAAASQAGNQIDNRGPEEHS